MRSHVVTRNATASRHVCQIHIVLVALSKFLDKLKQSVQPDGSTLLDHCAITLVSNISSVHSLTNCPTIIAGGGAGFKQGRHLVMDDAKTPLCNLWLSTLAGCGVKADSHGNSTGLIPELFEA